MAIRKIALNSLLVNRANDRHGELENETGAIAWLFNTHEDHMRNLAKDIVKQKEVYELPLVSPRMHRHLTQCSDCLRADHLSHLVLVLIARQHALAVMAGLVPAIHALTRVKTWLALTGTAMTTERGCLNRAEV
jgi:hypothetical protein